MRTWAFWGVLVRSGASRGLLGRLAASWSVLGRPEASWDRSEAFWHRSEAAFYGVLGGCTQNAQSMCYFCTILSLFWFPRSPGGHARPATAYGRNVGSYVPAKSYIPAKSYVLVKAYVLATLPPR